MKPKRITAFLLSVAMTISLLPTFTLTASADETPTTTTEKNIVLGTSALKGGQASNVYFGNYQQSSLGNTEPTEGTMGIDWIQSTTAVNNEQGAYYKKEPIKWRVLSKDESKLFLLSDKNLDVVHYHEDEEDVTWETSTIRSWLNGYGASLNTGGKDYTSDNFIGSAFSKNEQNAIATTKVINATYDGTSGTSPNPGYTSISGGIDTDDKVFLLSIAEAQNTAYGFTDNANSTDTRKAVNTAYVYGGGKNGTSDMYEVGIADFWWLRSPGDDTRRAALVDDHGGVYIDGLLVVNGPSAVRPAFNLNLSSVLFTSAAADGKKTENVGTLSANAENSGNEYKLTILDESRKFTVTETTAKCMTGETLQFNYDNANIGDNEYISAMIVNNAGEVIYYGQLAKAEPGKSAASLVLPSDIPYGAYTLNLFNEQINGDYKTDYASAFSDIKLIVGLEGSGTEQDPYLINNVKEFEYFRDSVSDGNKYTGKYINLTADIDLTGRTWSPIGVNYSDFEGIFDGQNHTISNMKFTAAKNGYGGDDHLTYDYQGLFGIIRNGAIVRNFTVTGEITLADDNQKYIGGAVGFAYEDALVSNVTSYVKITDGGTAYSGITDIGGVVGRIGNNYKKDTNGYVDWCRYYGEINVDTAFKVGGIVGCAIKNSSVTNSVNYGTVGWNYINHIGGVVGSTENEILVKNCANYGSVTACRNDCVGGIVGYIQNGTITNCLNGGSVTGKKSNQSNEPDVYLGGILGYQNNSSLKGVTNCFNYGKITDLDGNYTYTGAIVGYSKNATGGANIKDNYYLNSSLAGSEQKAAGSGTVGTNTSVTPIQAASGEISYKLQGTQSEQIWGQTIGTDNYPNLNGEKVYKVKFVTSDNADYATRYANKTGVGTLPENPGNGKWFCGETADSAEFTVTTPVTEDMKVYFRTEPDLIITTADEMKAFAAEVNGGNTYNGKYILLKNDLNLEGSENNQWTPIGTNSQNGFKGTFDGDGHKIIGLYINNNSNSQGLFGYVGKDGTVKNLIVNGTVYGKNYSGGIAGINEGTIENCSNIGSVNGESYVGGIAGINEGTIENCSNIGSVNGESYVGGIVGINEGTIENCSNIGSVNGESYVGGIVGNNFQTVKNCYNTGTVSGGTTSMYIGGVAGKNDQTVENCYNTGAVNGGTTSMYVGGIVGYNYKTVENCYNTGTVSGGTNEYVGGAFGYSAGVASIPNCFYLDTCAAEGTKLTYSKGVALTAEQIKNADEFTGFDFTNTWVIKIDRPLLKSNLEVQNFEIKSVGTDGTNVTATVFIPKAGTYTVVFADYESGGLNDVDIVTVTVTAEQLGENTVTSAKAITLGTGDKIMLWDNLENLTPLCEAYEVK